MSNASDGAGMDKKQQMQVEALAGIEIQSRKILIQGQDLQKLKQENSDLSTILTAENEKNQKLKVIAEEKYKMDVLKIDNYLPRGKEYQDKIKALERKKIHEAR